MSCINPLTVSTRWHNKVKNLTVPCGHCLNCLVKKQSQIEFLAKKELLENYKLGKSATFVTLTYDDSHIPINENGFVTLRRKDLQDFIKNMRRQIEYHNFNLQFKYLYCGEYGDGSHSTTESGISTNRPHYHLIFIGLSPEQTKLFTRKLWKHGLCDIGPLGAGGIRYLCKYMMKSTPDKDVKALRELCGQQNPFFYHSVGLAKTWINKNLDKIVEDNFTFNLNGKRYLFPKYVMQYVSNHTGVDFHRYVVDFLTIEALPLAKVKGINFQQYSYEESFIKYKYKVAALRSQNKPINDFTLSKKWVKPRHSVDRNISKLVADIKHYPIPPSKQNLKIPRDVFGNVNWDLYLYGDVVPF